ncbi:hypothetical protein RUM43_012018 [Polyplax serrata]|uniref:Uncharacterized protein n=1 Tax=Polyplax serrata TaxID=468196 RepID=A0AAN8S4A9_POLSC
MFDLEQDSIVYQEAVPYYSNRYHRDRYRYARAPTSHRYPRLSGRSYSNGRSPRCRSPESPSRVRPRSNSSSKSGDRLSSYSHSHRDYYLHVYYSSRFHQVG